MYWVCRLLHNIDTGHFTHILLLLIRTLHTHTHTHTRPTKHPNRYLDLSNWNLADALETAKQDVEWANGEIDEQQVNEALKAGQISIKVFDCSKEAMYGNGNKEILLKMKGTGHNQTNSRHTTSGEVVEEEEAKVCNSYDGVEHEDRTESSTKTKIYRKPPAIATNSIIAEDIYNVSCQSFWGTIQTDEISLSY